jgi:phosphoglycolate phosphatase-like HAD superfamily hydrolase
VTGLLAAVCDLDGTLLDSDEALLAPFLALGVAREAVGRGRPVAEECARHGIAVADYVAAYDTNAVRPYPGVAELVAGLERWAVCSNKHQDSGRAELARLGWEPEVALFTDAFDGPKRLGPVLERMGVAADAVVFLGDTAHDRTCAREVGATFALAGWNPATRAEPGDVVLARPDQLLDLLDGARGRPGAR